MDVVDGNRVGEGKTVLGLSLHLDSETVNLDPSERKIASRNGKTSLIAFARRWRESKFYAGRREGVRKRGFF